MATLAEIRAKLVEQQSKIDNKGATFDNATFPFWNGADNQSSTIRFLPDADPDNVYFWVERLVIRLPFQGVVGDSDKEVTVQVPCMEMYGESCPILSETRPWWRDPSLENLARRYWKKKAYVFNGFVVSSGVEEANVPENPVRRFVINNSIFKIIKSSLMNPEMDDLPIDYVSGRDFKLTKTKQGEFANYGTSNWSFKTRSLSPDEQEALKTYGLFNLKDQLPKKPNADELQAIKEMFQASVNDEAYDPAKWGNFYKPFGLNVGTNGNNGGGGSSAPVPATKPVATVVETMTPYVAPQVTTDSNDEEDEGTATVSGLDVIAAIRARNTGSIKPSEFKEAPKDTPKESPFEILQRIKQNMT